MFGPHTTDLPRKSSFIIPPPLFQPPIRQQRHWEVATLQGGSGKEHRMLLRGESRRITRLGDAFTGLANRRRAILPPLPVRLSPRIASQIHRLGFLLQLGVGAKSHPIASIHSAKGSRVAMVLICTTTPVFAPVLKPSAATESL